MARILLLFASIITVSSCKKSSVEAVPYSEATYQVTITGKWKSPEFTVPPFVHYTTFAGMVHNSKTNLWQPGKMASLGVENVAEVGSTSVLIAEVDSIILKGHALSKISIDPPTATGSITGTVLCNTNYPLVSFVSMLAPSPDWFTGLSSYGLFDGKMWVSDVEVNLYSYDAGTEEGDVFGYSNPPTMPQQNIQLLTSARATVLANGNPVLAPIATIRFRKL